MALKTVPPVPVPFYPGRTLAGSAGYPHNCDAHGDVVWKLARHDADMLFMFMFPMFMICAWQLHIKISSGNPAFINFFQD
jgi:hypothetical protein